MKNAPLPDNESERLRELHELSILDTLPEEEFDDITRLASEICQTPISLITLVDSGRQWFKSRIGLTSTETDRNSAFCAHAIITPQQILTVPDSRKDDRFFDNPLVTGDPHVIFYTGVPLVTSEGNALGTLCVIDHQPRELNPNQLETLRSLSRQVVRLIDLRKMNRLLNQSRTEVEQKNTELQKFAYIVSHDIKSPLNNIISITEILKESHSQGMDEEGLEMIGYLKSSSQQLKNLVDGILSYYAGDSLLSQKRTEFIFSHIIRETVDLLDPSGEHTIRFPQNDITLTSIESGVRQVLLNLISNAIKYNRSPKVVIDITFAQQDAGFIFTVKDNGVGIAADKLQTIFEPFVTLGVTDRFKNTGTGIGLSTVKKLVEKLGGTIRVSSEEGNGSEFTVTLRPMEI